MAAKVVTSQRDFSAGEVDATVKRDDTNPLMKAGARQARNCRILNSKGMTNRQGRRVLFLEDGRVDEISLAGATWFLVFGNGTLRVYDDDGAQVFTESGRPWRATTAASATFTIIDKSIYIAFPGARPHVLTYDGVSAWAGVDYAETVTLGGQKRTAFYRISPKNVTMLPAARTGTGIACTFSAGMNLTAGHIGTYLRYVGRQVKITAVASAVSATIDIMESLPGSQVLSFTVDPTATYNVGDEVQGAVSNSLGIVTNVNSGAKTITVQLLSLTATQTGRARGGPTAFLTTENVVSLAGSLIPSAGVSAIGVPQAVTIWDDEVMNSFRGWPASVSADQGRLIFTNFPSVPRGISWSAFGLPNDLYIDAQPTDGFFELAPEDCQVFHVLPGPESSEFVFTSKGVWYIAISATNPLKPGSVGFTRVSRDECANVRPCEVNEFILYLTAGLNQVFAIVPVGAYSRSYTTHDITELRSGLFSAPIAIAAPASSSAAYPERYIYIVNANGTLVVGKFTLSIKGQTSVEGIVGWAPWDGAGAVKWVSTLGADVIFTTTYGTVSLVERIDVSLYLDAAMLVNDPPAAIEAARPGGFGPLWWLAGGSLDLMDQGTRMMGTYQVDATGNIVPQGLGGEDLDAATLVAGQTWTATLEPFVPHVQEGQDVGQRMRRRRIPRAQIYVSRSSGFDMIRMYSGQSGPSLPDGGTVMKRRTIAAWNQGEDATQAPPLREQSYLDRPLGRSHDPRWGVEKATPGPLTIEEITIEVTV